MKYFLLIILFAFSLFVLSTVNFKVSYDKKGKDDSLNIMINYLNINIKEIKIPMMESGLKNLIPFISFYIKKNKKTSEKVVISPLRYEKIFYSIEHILLNYKKTSNYLINSIKIKDLELKIKYGFSDPAITGISAGILWGSIYFILGIVSKFLNLKHAKIKVDVCPDFANKENIQIKFTGIFQMKIGHIIIAAIVIPILWFSSIKRFKSKGATDYGWTSN